MKSVAVGLSFLGCLADRGSTLATFRVDAGNRVRVDVPVSISLSNLADVREANLWLEEISAGDAGRIPCQIEKGETPRLWWVLQGETAKGVQRVFRLSQGEPCSLDGVALEWDNTALTIVSQGSRVLKYNHAVVPPPKSASPRYQRSGFIHPIWSPSGSELTQIHPADHIHHFGLWGPWAKTEFEGHEIDFWNLNRGQGTVRFVRFLDRMSGPVFGGFRALQEHVWLQAPGGERVVLEEVIEVKVWNLTGAGGHRWLMDYCTSLRCSTTSPIVLKQYRYGGFGLRGARRWHNGNSDYLTSEGRTRRDGDGTRARWCDVFGETGSGIEGLLFMGHPENREHPEPMRIWPAAANNGRGDVFFNFCPIRYADWEINPGEDHVLKYRLFGHGGSTLADQAERLWQDFADPPSVLVE